MRYLVLVMLVGCGSDPVTGTCMVAGDCRSGWLCVRGMCWPHGQMIVDASADLDPQPADMSVPDLVSDLAASPDMHVVDDMTAPADLAMLDLVSAPDMTCQGNASIPADNVPCCLGLYKQFESDQHYHCCLARGATCSIGTCCLTAYPDYAYAEATCIQVSGTWTCCQVLDGGVQKCN